MIDAKLGPIQSQIGPRPWTEQPQGCGEPGFGIHVPSRFLDLGPSPLYKDSWELRTKGKLLLAGFLLCSVLSVSRQTKKDRAKVGSLSNP